MLIQTVAFHDSLWRQKRLISCCIFIFTTNLDLHEAYGSLCFVAILSLCLSTFYKCSLWRHKILWKFLLPGIYQKILSLVVEFCHLVRSAEMECELGPGRWKQFISGKFLRGPGSFCSFEPREAESSWGSVCKGRMTKGWKAAPLGFFKSQEPTADAMWMPDSAYYMAQETKADLLSVSWLAGSSRWDLGSNCSSDLTCSLAWGSLVTGPDSVAMEGEMLPC